MYSYWTLQCSKSKKTSAWKRGRLHFPFIESTDYVLELISKYLFLPTFHLAQYLLPVPQQIPSLYPGITENGLRKTNESQMKRPVASTSLYPSTVKGLCPLMAKLCWGKNWNAERALLFSEVQKGMKYNFKAKRNF